MLVEMSKTKRILAVIAIMSTAIAVMADLVLVPVYGLIYSEYPDQIGLVNYFVSGPMLITVVASLLTGPILKRANKKTVMIAGGVIFAIGAVLGNLSTNMLYMCVMRTLVGVGGGVTNVVAVSLITDLYDDVNQRAKINGYYNAAMSIVGAIFSYVAGIIATNQPWDNVYRIYWSAIPMVILLVLFIPSIQPVKEESQGTDAEKAKAKEPMGWRFWWMSFTFFLFNIIMGATVLYYLSPFIMENNIGGPDFVGLAASVKSIVGAILVIGFGFLYSKLKRHTITVMYLIAAVTMFILIKNPTATVVLTIGTICACTYKFAMPYAYTHGSSIVPKSRVDESISITTAVYGLGSFISSYYATWLLSVMKTDLFSKTWIVNVVILAVMVIADIVVANIEKTNTHKLEVQ